MLNTCGLTEYTEEMKKDETDLVRETLAGNKSAFDELVKLSSPRVFGMIYRFFSEKQQAEDIAQEVFIRAYSALHTYGQEKPFGNWLAAITTRLCYRELKKRKNRPEKIESCINFDGGSIIDTLCLDPDTAEKKNPEKTLALKELAEKLLEQLSPKERMLLVFAEVEGKSTCEIADLMDMSRVNVKVSSFRARNKAKKILTALIR